jgi:hypothetical protein
MRKAAFCAALLWPLLAWPQAAPPSGVSPISLTTATLNSSTLLSPGTLTLKGQVASAGAAVSVVIDAAALTDGKLVSFREAGAEYAYIDHARNFQWVGTDVVFGGGGSVNIQRDIYLTSGTNFISNSTGIPVRIADAQGLQVMPQALPTCAAGLEGTLLTQAAGGGTRTKLCMCTSDGGGAPAFAWQNLATAALGDTTTCG